MPIYAPSLPPAPPLGNGRHPVLVLLRFELRRVLRQKLGRFFGSAFAFILVIQSAVLYFKHLVAGSGNMASLRDFSNAVLPQGADFQAQLLSPWILALLWFQVALVGGGLVARDTLHRTRPLIYAHPVSPIHYLAAKGIFAAGLPLLVLLPFVLVPWGLSMLMAGLRGPVWPTAPLHLLPAALLISALMGAVALGASSLAATPRAGLGWVLGIVLGSGALARILAGALDNTAWLALSPTSLGVAWPSLLCGCEHPSMPWLPALLGTAAHLALWTWIASARTRPTEALP